MFSAISSTHRPNDRCAGKGSNLAPSRTSGNILHSPGHLDLHMPPFLSWVVHSLFWISVCSVLRHCQPGQSSLLLCRDLQPQSSSASSHAWLSTLASSPHTGLGFWLPRIEGQGHPWLPLILNPDLEAQGQLLPFHHCLITMTLAHSKKQIFDE